MGYIAGQEQKQLASRMAVIDEASEQLADLPKFWK
jgi:hypothetical protein